MARITNKTISEIEAEYSRWSEFLNGGIGIFAFSLGISCIGTPRPDITALLSLLFLLVFTAYGQRHFPQKLKALRKTELSGVDEVALLGIEKKYFGATAVFKNFPVYLIGWCFLGGVAIYGAFK
ncbi:MAG: hypothetical protein KJ852_12985 [Gammaproteobacteria bacterium]|nr:hypothetical protein [Gammaproteobacteria bacterium]MBU0786977.1 hypothetical protein [Gammaproteobacteria bacterium]MBU0816228.1 hypothetical protein [Gammaproteobacteria bacterium]MBU1787865.1 hypothetical protein [Gammaproteobacteria bacterium]